MENILQFFSIWQKLKVTVSPLFTAPRDLKFSETFFHPVPHYCEFCHIMEWKSGISSNVDLQLHSALDCFLFWLIANTGLQNLLFWESLFHLCHVLDCYLLPGPGSNVLPLWQFDQWPCCMPLQTKSAENNNIIESIITNI